jgi:hypothetical protein
VLVAIPALADAPEIVVRTSAELIEAIEAGPGARTIRLRAGRYMLEAPLRVPDGVALVGEGVMRLDAEGLPDRFTPGTVTTLVAGDRFVGDVVTLGDGARLEKLRIESPDRAEGPRDPPAANVVVIVSRRPGDRVRAALRDCEIVNHSGGGIGPVLPAGRAIAVLTVNPRAGTPPHDGALVSATIERSIVRNTTGSDSIFSINFASAGTVELDLEGNRLEGTFGTAGGVGRPDRVRGSKAVVRSRGNLYVYSGGPYSVGWVLLGASVSPHAEIPSQGAESSSVRVESEDDRIEGFRVGVMAAAGRLVKDLPGSIVGNRVEVSLRRLAVRTVGEGAVDLSLHGALHMQGPGNVAEPEASNRLADNVLRVSIRDSSGSGPRGNQYAHASLSGAADIAHRNRLEIAETRAEFLESNARFDPAPGAGFFTAPRGGR